MRLIDGDALIERLKQYKDKYGAEKFPYDIVHDAFIYEVEKEPTVEAVPAEYIIEKITDLDNSIKKYGGRFDYSASVDSWIHRRGALEGLIAEWEETED